MKDKIVTNKLSKDKAARKLELALTIKRLKSFTDQEIAEMNDISRETLDQRYKKFLKKELEIPDDYRIYNRKQKDGTYKEIKDFFIKKEGGSK